MLGNFVDETHLEEFVDNFEDEVFREEVVVVLADAAVNAVECQTMLINLLEFLCDEVPQLLSLILNRVHILISLTLQLIKEALLFKFSQAFS